MEEAGVEENTGAVGVIVLGVGLGVIVTYFLILRAIAKCAGTLSLNAGRPTMRICSTCGTGTNRSQEASSCLE